MSDISSFPTSLDSFTDPVTGNTITAASARKYNDAIEKIETKVGIDNSGVTTSLDYQIENHTHSGTGYILLPVDGGVQPDGTSGNAAATSVRITSSGTPQTNAPKLTFNVLSFDQTTDQHWMWGFMLPGDYASGTTLRLRWSSLVTTGNVAWKAGMRGMVDDSTDTDASTFPVPITGVATVSTTVGRVQEMAFTMGAAAGTLAANRQTVLFVGRDADSISDTAAGAAYLHSVIFEYAST